MAIYGERERNRSDHPACACSPHFVMKKTAVLKESELATTPALSFFLFRNWAIEKAEI
tara:strand:+ start:515 stop:688 length:174 start_codon:yes stop_codon:yes gene_type:complete